MSATATLRRRLAALFDDDIQRSGATRAFNAALAALIVVNVGAVILESVESVRAQYPIMFVAIENFATGIFAIEYALRVWAAVDLQNPAYREPVRGRLRYIVSFFALVDLASILPGVLGLLGAGDLRVLRLLRLLRMLKLTRHSKIFGLIWAVLVEESRAIGALVFIVCMTVTISGALMYLIEADQQPTTFSSIPAAMWWAIETITTVGYGDMVPSTALGRFMGGLVAIIGIGTLALFSGLITVGFIDQLRIRRERAEEAQAARAGNLCPHCGRPLEAPAAPTA